MSDPREKIRVYFVDNTYRTLPLKYETSAVEIVEYLCQWFSADTSNLDPTCHGLFIIAPGNLTIKERRLLHEDKPLQIQASGGESVFKFLFREIRHDGELGGSENCSNNWGMDNNLEKTLESEDVASVSGKPMEHIIMQLKAGPLDRLLDDGTNWHKCMCILDVDRLWYSQATAEQGDAVGGGMKFLLLGECNRIDGGEDKRVVTLSSKTGLPVTLRASTVEDGSDWLYALVKQAGLIKEHNVLTQLERAIANMEVKHSTKQLELLQSLDSLSGIVANEPARELLSNFIRSEYGGRSSIVEIDGQPSSPEWWPNAMTLDATLSCLQPAALTECGGESPEKTVSCGDETAWSFVESVLLPRFQDDFAMQGRICAIAAGIS